MQAGMQHSGELKSSSNSVCCSPRSFFSFFFLGMIVQMQQKVALPVEPSVLHSPYRTTQMDWNLKEEPKMRCCPCLQPISAATRAAFRTSPFSSSSLSILQMLNFACILGQFWVASFDTKGLKICLFECSGFGFYILGFSEFSGCLGLGFSGYRFFGGGFQIFRGFSGFGIIGFVRFLFWVLRVI